MTTDVSEGQSSLPGKTYRTATATFQNFFPGTIQNLTFTHFYGSNQDQISSPTVYAGGKELMEVHYITGDGVADYWFVQFVDALGNAWQSDKHKCNLYTGDAGSDFFVTISLAATGQATLSIAPPSGTCTTHLKIIGGVDDLLEPHLPEALQTEAKEDR